MSASLWTAFRNPEESAEDRAIRIVTETITVHQASRLERGEGSPLSEDDKARITLIKLLLQRHPQAILPIVKAAWPGVGTFREKPDETPPGEDHGINGDAA